MKEKQNNKCALSGLEMDWSINTPWKVSIDRIDPQNGYLKSNTRLTCWIANNAHSDFSFEDFKELCINVANYNNSTRVSKHILTT